MKTFRLRTGPFSERPHFALNEIEEICDKELRSVGLYPSKPERIRIDRFIAKRFKITEKYEPLPNGVLGFTKFGPNGVEEIVIARSLEDAEGKASERRIRATLAHEAGHGLLHAYLFALEAESNALFGDMRSGPKILCREVSGESSSRTGYNGQWSEFQANRAIGGLLMPRRLVEMALEEFTTSAGSFGQRALAPDRKEAALRFLAETFDVNPIVVRIRLDDVLPSKNEAQLPL